MWIGDGVGDIPHMREKIPCLRLGDRGAGGDKRVDEASVTALGCRKSLGFVIVQKGKSRGGEISGLDGTKVCFDMKVS